MKLKVITQSPYTFLPSGVLIVEPHEGLLAARTMLLAAADYYLGLSAFANGQVYQNEGHRYEVAFAVLSKSLGRVPLTTTAQGSRQRWPSARILIYGRSQAAIEDNLYDSRIDHRARPEDLLAALLALSQDPWNQRTRPAKSPATGRMRYLNQDNRLSRPIESDPSKQPATTVNARFRHDIPGGEPRLRPAT